MKERSFYPAYRICHHHQLCSHGSKRVKCRCTCVYFCPTQWQVCHHYGNGWWYHNHVSHTSMTINCLLNIIFSSFPPTGETWVLLSIYMRITVRPLVTTCYPSKLGTGSQLETFYSLISWCYTSLLFSLIPVQVTQRKKAPQKLPAYFK